MAASLCPLTTQSGASCNAISVGSRKDWEEYIQKRLGKVTLAPPSLVVIEEIIESLMDPGSSDSRKRQASLTIRGLIPLVLALPTIAKPTLPPIVPAIQGFDPLILQKTALGISRVSGLKAPEAILPTAVVINPKTFSVAPNLQTQEGVIIRMPKIFPYEDSHRVPRKYDGSLSLSGLTRSGRYYTPEELEKRKKEIGKGTVKPVKDKVTIEEAKEFLKVIRNLEYSVIQQLNKLPAQISVLALLLSSEVHHKALLKVLKETSATESTFKAMVSTVLATNQISFTNDELPPEGRAHTLPMQIIVKCEDMIVTRVLIDNGSALNVCSMSSLEHLNVNTSLIRPTTMIISAFDGTLWEVQGEIELAIGVGPMFFTINFQVIKVDSPYNMLLRRPWLHAAGVVVSTFHQRLKFPSKDLMITIMAKEPLVRFSALKSYCMMLCMTLCMT